MRLDGIYKGEAKTPEKVQAAGTQDEWDTLSAPYTPVVGERSWFDPLRGIKTVTGHITDLPPDRDLVNDIARHVEVQCDDQRLIDWMSGKE